MKPKSAKRTSLYLTIPQLDRLGVLSERTGLSQAELVRRAVDILIASYGDDHGRENTDGGAKVRSVTGG